MITRKMCLILILLLISPAFAVTCERAIPSNIDPGSDVTIRIDVDVTDYYADIAGGGYGVKEKILDNWIFKSIISGPCSKNGSFIRCMESANKTGTIEYIVTAPAQEGIYKFYSNCSTNGTLFNMTGDLTAIVGNVTSTNNPPNTPPKPSGEELAVEGTYEYSTSTTDPDGDKIKYEWDFNGDGNVDDSSDYVASGSTDSRSHFFSVGTYNIRVRARDNQSSISPWSEAKILTIYSPLSVDIGDNYTAYKDYDIQFHSQTTGGVKPYTFNWNFGDGGTSNQENPVHQYTKTGTYTVSLETTDNVGTTVSDSATVTVNPGSPPNPDAETDSGRVTRVLSSTTTNPGSTVTVNLVVKITNATVVTIEDYLPAGFSISDMGSTNCSKSIEDNRERIRCVLIKNVNNTILTYTVFIPESTSLGVYDIIGTYATDDLVVRSISGESTITVQETPEFSFSIDSTNIKTQQNTTKTAKISVISTSTYNKVVVLSATNLPPNLAVDISPQSGTPPFNSTATMNIGAVNYGNSTIAIKGTDTDGKTHYKTINLEVVKVDNRPILTVDTRPIDGEIFVDGESWGTAPQTKRVQPGEHEISFGDVENYTAPDPVSIELPIGANQTVIKTYEHIADCGDGFCTGDETHESCPIDCPADIEFDYSVIPPNDLILTAESIDKNTNAVWNISDPSLFIITYVKLLTKNKLKDVEINITRVHDTGLENGYAYFNITTNNIANDDIANATIGFAVRRTWFQTNNIEPEEIKLNKYDSGWKELETEPEFVTVDYNYYKAESSGLFRFGINSPPKQCDCEDPSPWSSCSNGQKSRTVYECNQETDYECIAKTEKQACCDDDDKPESSEWSECINGQKTRTVYQCDTTGDYGEWKEKTETQDCVSQQDALNAINRAQDAIDKAKNENKNTSTAESLLARANNSYNTGDYATAQSLANSAKTAAENAPVKEQPFFLPVPLKYLLMIIIIAVVAVAAFFLYKRYGYKLHKTPSVSTQICSICGKQTAMDFRCSNCGQPVCFKDARIYKGRIYDTNCLKQILQAKGVNENK